MDLPDALRTHFGFTEFRPGQEAVIRALLDGESALALFPTGAGKSLCYQLPAVLSEGTALVISPLIALMKDQVDALRARGISAARLDSSLAALCDEQILRKKKAEVLQSLEGDWQEHHLFALRQALAAYRFYHQQIAACDARIEALLHTLNAPRPPQAPKPGQKIKIVRHNAPQIANLHGQLLTLAQGCDATLLPGISPLGWLKLTGEVGTDLRAFPTEHHFAAWAGLTPQLHQSGSRHRRRPRPKTKIGQIFREAAMSIAKSKHLALGGFYRRIKGRRGAAVAIVATARKLAILFYRVMTRGLDYVEHGLAQYEAHHRAQSEHHLRKLAARLGFRLCPKSTDAL